MDNYWSKGPLDEFSYNYSDGFAELKRLCEIDGVSAYYVLGEPYETLISNSLGEKKIGSGQLNY